MGKKNFKKKQTKSLAERRKEHKEALKSAPQDQNQKPTNGAQTHSLDQILDKAQQLIDEFNYELAQKFCQKALERDPDNVRALETSASLLLELGNTESAKHCLGRAVEVCPESGFSKYMTLGQLMEGATAVQIFQKGIELMLKEKQTKQQQEVAAACSNNREVSDRDISSAYCAVAEIFLTDCCFDDSAEAKCKEHVEKAVAADPTNPEALQIKANFLMSTNDNEGAREMIKRSVSLWLPKLQEADTAKATEEEFDPVELCPINFTTRMQCGKILTEVEEYDTAVEVLETLLDEDDEVPDVWYLLGWANYLQGKDYFCNARHYLEKGKEVYKKVKHDDVALFGHMEELLKEMGPEDASNETEEPLEIVSSGEEEAMDH